MDGRSPRALNQGDGDLLDRLSDPRRQFPRRT